MQKIVAIVAGISGKEIAIELIKLKYKVAVIGGREDEPGMDIANLVLHTDLSNQKKILNFLNENNINEVIFGTGHIKAIYLAEYLNRNQIKTSIDPRRSIIAKDKYLYKELLIRLGIHTPRYILIKVSDEADLKDIIAKIDVPCVIKSTTDATYPQKINSSSELLKTIKEFQKFNTDILIEEYIEGVDVTIPFIANYEKVSSVLVSYYSKAKECNLKGFNNFSELKLDKRVEGELLKYSEKIVKETGIIGVGRLDIIVKGDIYYVLECNSVMVTGLHPNQIEYGLEFLKREDINFPKMLVDNALSLFLNKKREYFI
jgi:phosphoribosylaminoimidazole carboxylase (NCAIR synthetase)